MFAKCYNVLIRHRPVSWITLNVCHRIRTQVFTFQGVNYLRGKLHLAELLWTIIEMISPCFFARRIFPLKLRGNIPSTLSRDIDPWPQHQSHQLIILISVQSFDRKPGNKYLAKLWQKLLQKRKVMKGNKRIFWMIYNFVDRKQRFLSRSLSLSHRSLSLSILTRHHPIFILFLLAAVGLIPTARWLSGTPQKRQRARVRKKERKREM